jgi:hypothetical protein
VRRAERSISASSERTAARLVSDRADRFSDRFTLVLQGGRTPVQLLGALMDRPLGIGLEPDVEVHPSAASIAAGVDRALERSVPLARRQIGAAAPRVNGRCRGRSR